MLTNRGNMSTTANKHNIAHINYDNVYTRIAKRAARVLSQLKDVSRSQAVTYTVMCQYLGSDAR